MSLQPASSRITPHRCVMDRMSEAAAALEKQLDADVITFKGDILGGADDVFREAVEKRRDDRREALAVVLETSGGFIEVVQRIVDTLRKHYSKVYFIVPNHAMSAGTVLVLSGDRIFMDYYSVLGPIDPQVPSVNGDTLVPALGYLTQYGRLLEKAASAEGITQAEAAILMNFDQAELYRYEQARNLTITLLKDWLTKYKFSNWHTTEDRKLPVTPEMKTKRAQEIAEILNDPERWHTHGRGVSMKVARDLLKLHVEDFEEDRALNDAIREYYRLFVDYTLTLGKEGAIHTSKHFWPLEYGGSNAATI